jgi:ABC-type transport system involved in multi-copper enzyme maturation permease subunit
MTELPLSLPYMPVAQAASWMTAWLTPIWFLAAGTAMGLIALLLLTLLFKLLSNVKPWEQLSHGPAGHAVAAVLTAALAAGIWFSLPVTFIGNSELNEPLLLGIALVLLCSIVGWALVFCCSKQPAKYAFSTLGEGVAGYLGITTLVIVFVGAAAWGVGVAMGTPIVADPLKAFSSIPLLFSTGETVVERTIPAAPATGESPFVPVDVPVDFELLSGLTVESDKTVILADAANSSSFSRVPIRLGAGDSIVWDRRSQKFEDLPIPTAEGSQLHVQNVEVYESKLKFTLTTVPPVREAATLLITALAVVLVGLMLMLQQAVAPRASAVSHATLKNELAQPLFLVLMVLGIVAVVLYTFLSFNTFGEDIKLLKDCGITTIMLLAAFQGIWSASSSISEEIEGKTALTVLSKPIQRRSFVIGKFLGIFWLLFLMFVILGTFELAAVAYKPIYDAREASEEAATWNECHMEMVRTIPGLAMAFMQSIVLTAISVALATRLPQLANLSICFAIYVIGNLTTSLVSTTQEGFEIVKFVASLVATIIPILEHFSLQAAIDADNPITMSLLSGNLVYCLLYVLLAMFLALLLFEDRDLA